MRAAAGRREVTLVGLSLDWGLPKNIKKDSWPVKTHDAVTCSELCGRVSRVSSLRATIFVCVPFLATVIGTKKDILDKNGTVSVCNSYLCCER